jgi:hypothetical protein
MILYFLARNIYALGVHLQYKNVIPSKISGFPILAAICWGFAMCMFEERRKSLSGSLSRAMNFCFRECDEYKKWTDYVPFYVPEKLELWVNKRFFP